MFNLPDGRSDNVVCSKTNQEVVLAEQTMLIFDVSGIFWLLQLLFKKLQHFKARGKVSLIFKLSTLHPFIFLFYMTLKCTLSIVHYNYCYLETMRRDAGCQMDSSERSV